MTPPSRLHQNHKAFTLVEVMVAFSLFILAMTAVIGTVLATNNYIRHQEMTFEVGDAASRIVGYLNKDSSGVGVVQLFSLSNPNARPPYAAGTWNGTGKTGNVLALAYPTNRLDQSSLIGKMCLYYVNPSDNTLIRDELDFTKVTGGGINLNAIADLMDLYNMRYNSIIGKDILVKTIPLARVYPWALTNAAPKSNNPTNGIAAFSSGPNSAQTIFSSEGPPAKILPLAIMCTVASIKGSDTAKSTLVYTLNLHD